MCCGAFSWRPLIRFQIVCIGSVEELERLSGVTGITDLHRDKIDHITIPSETGRGVLRRVEEVFDCWFESGRYAINLLSRSITYASNYQHAIRTSPLSIREQGEIRQHVPRTLHLRRNRPNSRLVLHIARSRDPSVQQSPLEKPDHYRPCVSCVSIIWT